MFMHTWRAVKPLEWWLQGSLAPGVVIASLRRYVVRFIMELQRSECMAHELLRTYLHPGFVVNNFALDRP
jgi:hypothetical protein